MDDNLLINNIINSSNEEYLNIVKEILDNAEFQKRKDYKHHEKRSVYAHSLMVSFKAYTVAKKIKIDYRAVAIGGLLHDFYYEDWQKNNHKKKFFKKHGFVHAKEALDNSKKIFPLLMNKKIENIILRHMFPLNIIPPKYKEAWLVSIIDKKVSMEIFKTPRQFKKYLGLGRNKNE